MGHSDELRQLVRDAQAGNQDSVGKLFELLSDRVYRFLLLRTSSVEVAEDLTQTVFLEMVRSLPRYKEQSNAKFSTWLFQIAHFRLIDYYRQRHQDVAIDAIPELPAEEREITDPVDLARLDDALHELPDRYRTVIHLRFREGLSAKEVAQIMNTSSINVRVLQSRAVAMLRKLLLQ